MSNDGTFRPIGESEERMFGPTKLIVSGYDKAQKEEFLSLLSAIGLGELGVVFATDGDGETPLLQLASRPHKSGFDSRSTFPRAIVMSGLTENELPPSWGAGAPFRCLASFGQHSPPTPRTGDCWPCCRSLQRKPKPWPKPKESRSKRQPTIEGLSGITGMFTGAGQLPQRALKE